MIVDTSALVATVYCEAGTEGIFRALRDESGVIPAPVIIELHRVASLDGNQPHPDALGLLDVLERAGYRIAEFDRMMAGLSVEANIRYGSGNGKGGKLNLLDLMVYAAAKTLDLPILCTGYDFMSTDAKIHPASRIG